MKLRFPRPWIIACLLGAPSLSHGAEKTFSWTGGLDSWDSGSRWQTIDGTGVIPSNIDYTIMVGENAIGRVLLENGIARNAGRLWLGTGSVVEINGASINLASSSGFSGAGVLAGHGELLIKQPDATTNSTLSLYNGDVRFDSGGESLAGGGTVTLDMTNGVHSGYNVGIIGSSSYTLTNADWLIHGRGILRIPFNQRPYGIVRADLSGGVLLVDEKVDANLGIMEADGGILRFFNGNLIRQWKTGDPATGTLRVKNNGLIETINRTIESGTLENITTGPNTSGKISLKGTTYLIGRTGQPATINGRVDFEDDYYNSTTNPSPRRLNARLQGPVHNTGEIHITGGDPGESSSATLYFGDTSPGHATNLTGGGKLFVHSFSPARMNISGPDEIDRGLININNTIEVTTNLGMPRAFQNLAAGSIGVASPGTTLDLTGNPLSGIRNSGTLFARNGGKLRINRIRYNDPLYPGFDNTNGTVQIDGDGTENASQVEFVGSSWNSSTIGGKVANFGGRVLITGTGSLYAAGWDTGHHFTNVTFEGASPQGEVEITPGIGATWTNCTLKGTGHLKGGILVVNGALNGTGTIIMSSGIHPADGQTYSPEILTHADRRYGPPANTWPVENELITSCFLQGGGRIQAKKITFLGGGVIASGAGQTMDLSGLASFGGNPTLRAQNGGTLKVTPPPAGLVLPKGQNLATLGGTIRSNGGFPLIANDGASLLANDGGSLIANDGGSLIANDGGSLIANDGGSLIANDGGSLIANDGGSLIANDGGSLIANDGAGLLANDGGSLIANDGGSLIANDGAGILSDQGGGIFATATASLRINLGLGGSMSAKDATPGILHIKSGGLLAPSSNVNGKVPPHGTPGQINAEANTVFDGGAMLQCEIGGTSPVTGYDQTRITGNVTFNGNLVVRILGNFGAQLNSGMSFTVLTGTAITGTPGNVSGGRVATADGLGSFRFTASSTAYVLDDFQATPGLVQTYASYSSTNTLAGLAGDDDDKDGTKNFAEYAFGTNPKAMSFPPAAQEETIDGQQWLVIHYVRRAAHSLAGLSVVAQRSTDLSTWTTDGVIDEPDPTVTSPAPHTDPRRARILKGTGKDFLRLRATTP